MRVGGEGLWCMCGVPRLCLDALEGGFEAFLCVQVGGEGGVVLLRGGRGGFEGSGGRLILCIPTRGLSIRESRLYHSTSGAGWVVEV